jgi:uncharacterized membrane protein (DUF485 family)
MRRQLSLSLKISAIFLAMLLGLPLVNYFLPGLANVRVFGFTATWLFLAVLFYPITWILSWMFIRQSNDIEADIADTMRRDPAALHGGTPTTPAAASSDAYIPANADSVPPAESQHRTEENI